MVTMEQQNGFYRPTWIEVDLEAIAHNFDLLRKKLRPETQILIPVKADAYGHGAVEVAKTLVPLGASFFGVATIEEAISLRKGGIHTPILVLNAILGEEIDAVPEYDLTQTVGSEEAATSLNQEGKRWKKKIPVHLKVDTGMGRLGIWYEEALALTRFIQGCPNLFLEGLFTHLANADDANPDMTVTQIRRFTDLIEKLKKENLLPPLVHMANSAAVLHYPTAHFNLVRPGLAVYGIHPFYERGMSLSSELKPALALKSRIVYLKKTPKGRTISYGGTYLTPRDTLIATLPIGYADGYNRLLSNRASVLLQGQKVPVAGRICMDQTMVDVGMVPHVSVGEEVVLIGCQGGEEIRVEELSTLCKTIPYEFLCRLSSRIPRIYVNAPRPLASVRQPLY